MLIHRHSQDHDELGNVVQVGCRIIVDGEARAEAWEQVGPFDDGPAVQSLACFSASNLYMRQMPGQQHLL